MQVSVSFCVIINDFVCLFLVIMAKLLDILR